MPLFELIANGDIEAVTPVVTLIEVLTEPLQQARKNLARRYQELLTRSAHITVYNLDERLAVLSAELRARYGLRMPDAIQAATALEYSSGVPVCNDKDMKRIKRLKVLLLDELKK